MFPGRLFATRPATPTIFPMVAATVVRAPSPLAVARRNGPSRRWWPRAGRSPPRRWAQSWMTSALPMAVFDWRGPTTRWLSSMWRAWRRAKIPLDSPKPASSSLRPLPFRTAVTWSRSRLIRIPALSPSYAIRSLRTWATCSIRCSSMARCKVASPWASGRRWAR